MWKIIMQQDFSINNKEKEEFSECLTLNESKKMPGLRTGMPSAVGCCWRTNSIIQLGRMTEGV